MTSDATNTSSNQTLSSPMAALVEFGLALGGVAAGGLLILLGIGLCHLFFWLEAVSAKGIVLVGLCFLGGALLAVISALTSPCIFFAHRMYWAGTATCLLWLAVGYRLLGL